MQPTSVGPRFASSIHSTDAVMTSQEVACASCELLLLAGLPSTSLMTTGPVEQAAGRNLLHLQSTVSDYSMDDQWPRDMPRGA